MSNIVFVLSSLLLGWVVLVPARRSFDAVTFHCLALPLGLMSWIGPILLFAALGRPWTPVLMLVAALVASLLMMGVFVWASRGASGPGVRPWTFAVAGLAAAAAAWVQVFKGFSMVSFDSYGHWEASGIWLHEVGTLESWMMSGRSVLIPSWQAAERTFGGLWGGAVYPLLAATLLILLGRILWAGPFSRLPMAARIGLTLLVPALLVLTPAFEYHAFLVHTHMAAALYLLGSVGCLAAIVVEPDDAGSRPAPLLAASGLLAAGFALSRPDTPAYLLLPMGVFAALWLGGAIRARSAWFWVPLLAPLWVTYGFAFARLGFWDSTAKLTGKVALLVIVALSVVPLLAAAARSIPFSRRVIRCPADAMRMIALAEALGLIVLLYTVRAGFVVAASNMVTNLFSAGSQGFAWFFAVGVICCAPLLPSVRRRAPVGDAVLFATYQFFVVALGVHAATHTGRIGLNDTFNRVSFHVLPFVFLYFGVMAGAALHVLLGTGPSSSPERPSASAERHATLRREAAILLAALALLAAALVFAARTHVSFSPANRQSSNSFDEIVLHQSGGGQLSFEIGIGLRQAAGAQLQDLRIPNRRHIVPRDMYLRDVVSKQILRLLLRGRVTVGNYDPRITDERLTWMLQHQPLRNLSSPRAPVYLVGPPSTRYVVRTDSRSRTCYVVPLEVDRQLGAWPGAPLPPDEGQPTDPAEIP
jgi:hypothetical protein